MDHSNGNIELELDPETEAKLSPEQTEEVREVFTLFDRDGDGTISVDHVGTVLRALGQYPTEEELEKLQAEIREKEGSDSIGFAQFAKILVRQRAGCPWEPQGSEDELREAFRVFDKGGEGVLSAGELRRALTTLGEALTEEELQEMMRDYPADGDGLVAYEGFLKTLAK